MQSAREIAAKRGRPIALLQDLSGPKIRTGKVKGGVPVELRDGARLRITIDETVEGTADLISTTYDPLPRTSRPATRSCSTTATWSCRSWAAAEETVDCEVVHGGLLKSNKGMNLPGVKLSTPALTEKDRRDLAFGVAQGVDWVALSFVRQAADVEETKALIASLGGSVPVIAKIEKREAIDDLAQIVEVADGLMVARGDLGVELSTEEVPTLQKRIIQMANGAGKVVITATQMLESMIENARPTRAEASDVANAILDGTDAIMLSAETASGRFPVESVETMARIARYTEEHYAFRRADRSVAGPRLDGRAEPGAGGGDGGRGARLQADRGLHGVGLHRAARLVASGRGPPSPPSPTTTRPTGASRCGGGSCPSGRPSRPAPTR